MSLKFTSRNRFRMLASLLLFFIAVKSDAQVVINEVMSSNFSAMQDEDGKYNDWIEIYNAGNSSVNISGYGLSDDVTDKFKFTFPDFILASHEHVLVIANDENKTLIGAHWESAVRADDNWRYYVNNTTAPDTNWRNLSFNESVWSIGTGGIGMEDGDDQTIIPACTTLFMRKTFVVPDTSKILDAVFNMDYDDGFVAYLNGVEIARANTGFPGSRPLWNDYAFASYEAQMYQDMPCDSFHIDDALVHSILQPGMNVLAVEVHNQNINSNDLTAIPFLSFKLKDASTFFSPVPSWFRSNQHAEDLLHAKFKISKTGEPIYLTNPGGSTVDQIDIPSLEFDNSYGRSTDGNSSWSYFEKSTPDSANSLSIPSGGYATIPMFSLQGGFYQGTQSLQLTTNYPGGMIRYTINGDMPNGNSTLYTGPINIASTKTIRARVFTATGLPSQCITNTYFINLNCKLPVYSLALDSADLWDYYKGIFVKGPNANPAAPYFGANYWQDWEKYMSLEFFDRQKTRVFKFNAGLSITGGWSRRYDQKALEVHLGDRYGLSKIQYAMEPDKKWIDQWDNFLLHTSGNDRGYAHMRDPVMEKLMKGTFSDYTAYTPCILFINGVQWGIYYTKENDDDNFIRLNYGYDKDEIDLLKESYLYPDMEVKCGDDAAFRSMHSFAMNSNPSSLAFYAAMDSMMDLRNQVDYFIAECYYPNDDWMGASNNNLKIWRPRKEGGRFRYLLYDLDFGLGMYGSVSDDILSIALNPSPHNYNSDIFQRLLMNPKYRNYFINRYADLVNTIWQPSNVLSVINSYKDSMRYDMHFQFDKWGNGDTNTWKANIDNMINFSNNRPSYARSQVQNDFGLSGQVTITLQASPVGSGRIKISTITPKTLPWTGVYFNGNPVTVTAIPNPGYTFDHWHSGNTFLTNDTSRTAVRNFTVNDVVTAYFTGTPINPQISISEINYNSDSAANAGDWIELHNTSNVALDISGWKIKDQNEGHEYLFPTTTEIPAQGFLVIAEDLKKFMVQHPTVTNVIGETGFNFGNANDQVRLFNYNDSLYLSIEYSDQLPWPSGADGDGYTLEFNSSFGDPNNGASWFTGCLGGSPGVGYSAPVSAFTFSAQNPLCSGDTVSLNAVTESGNHYQWIYNNTIISGATDVVYPAAQTGTYRLSVSRNGCTTQSDSVPFVFNQRSEEPVTTSAFRCGAGSITLSAVSIDPVTWYDSLMSQVAIGYSFTTPSLTQTSVYYARSGNTCPSNFVTDTASIFPLPADPIVTGASICGEGSIILVATSNAPIKWFDAPNGNYLGNGDTLIIPTLIETTTYFAQSGNDCQSAFVPVDAILIPVAADPVTSSVSSCDPGSITLYASATDTIKWYDAPGGNLLFTGSVFQTPVINTTTTYYLQAGNSCPGNFVSVQAIVSSVTPDPVVTSQFNCGPGSITLSATATDTVRWYDAVDGNLLFTGNQFVTPALSSSTTYFARAGAACASGFVEAEAIILSIAEDPMVTSSSRCGEGAVLLSATASDTVKWYDAPDGNLLSEGSTFTTPLLQSSGTFYVRAGGICPGNFIPVTASILPMPSSPVVANQVRCGSGQVIFTASGMDSIRWYDMPNGNLLAEGSSFTTPVLNQTTNYSVRTENICQSDFVTVDAVINQLPADPTLSSGSTCGIGVVTLSAVSSDTVYWYDNPNGNRLGMGLTYETPVIDSSTTYYAEAVNGCESNFVAVKAYVYSLPEFTLGNDTIIESGSDVVLNAGSGFSNYLWNNGETTQTVQVNSTGNYWVTVTDFNGCEATDTLQVLVTVNVQPYVLSEGVLIYPNPTHSSLSVSFMNEEQKEIYLWLISSDGKMIWSDHSIKERRVMRNIELEQYARGMYIFQIVTGDIKKEYKVVLK